MLKQVITLSLAAFTFAACSGGHVSSGNRSEGPAATAVNWSNLATRRIFFGHQSVGYNILEGVADVQSAHGRAGLRITETASPAEMKPGVLAHTPVGQNGDPLSKLRAFAGHLDAGIGANTDVALFKHCYIDVVGTTDVAQVFKKYTEEMDRLQTRYPDVRFVHVTIPLRKVQTGPKALVKRVLGRVPGGYLENARRNEYNELLRAHYAGKATVFDLAQIEASLPDGATTTFRHGGREFLALNPDYTYDNGHLNPTGRRLVAERFLATLAAD